MAESEEDELPRCSTLFLTEDGSPMHFYMTPSAMKTRLRPLIHHGGGELSSKILAESSIRLADRATGGDLCGYLSTDYIFDSIKHNRLQDMERYRLKSSSRTTIKGSKGQKHISPSTIKVSSSSRSGRHAYDDKDDMALLLFVKEHKEGYPIKGNMLYKKAAQAKVTSHTWQSMRDHYIKVLHGRKKPSDYQDLISKEARKKHPVVLKQKTLNSQAGQARKTRSQTASSMKKTDDKKDSDLGPSDAERKVVIGQARKTRSQKASPRKKIDDDETADLGPSDTEQNTVIGQTRKTRSQTASPRKKIDYTDEEEDETDSGPSDTEQNAVIDQARKTKSQTVSPRKKIDDKKDSGPSHTDQNANKLPDVSSADNADDENSAGEDIDYDKLFDDNLLQLAYESKVEKERNEVGSHSRETQDITEVNQVSSTQDAEETENMRKQKKPVDEQETISDFDGEVSVREGLKRPSADHEGDKRPIAKRNKRDLVCDGKEAQVKERFFKRYRELQLNIQRLESHWTVPQIIHALLINSGMLDDAETYLQHGTAGKDQWNSKEDKILLSKNKEAISSLAKTRGLQAVVNRIDYMEGIS